jgi:hypothetical protein
MRQVLGIHTALTDANRAYQAAEEVIQQAGSLGMIVTEAEIKLAEARTSLISARAAVHTTKLPVVTDLTDEALASADTARKFATVKLDENLFRRMSMVVAVVIILLIIVTLIILKRTLDQELKTAAAVKVAAREVKTNVEPTELDVARPLKPVESEND